MTWLLFDYGNVLSFPHTGQDVAEMATVAGCSPADMESAYWEYRLLYDRADLDSATYWQKVGAAAGTAISPGQVAELIRIDIASWSRLNPASEALVRDLSAAGHRLALLSNAPTEIARAIEVLPGISGFEHRVFSCDLRAVKPDPAVYQTVLARLRASPRDVVFLDDRAENITGAAAMGLRTVHFSDPGSARTLLAAQGIPVA